MTDFAIEEQLKAIKKATDKAVKSKQSLRNFLIEAGIMEGINSKLLKYSSKKKK